MYFRSHVSGRIPPDGFSWNFIIQIFNKIGRYIPILIKIGENNLHEDLPIFMISRRD
jgi:hypothetical protein